MAKFEGLPEGRVWANLEEPGLYADSVTAFASLEGEKATIRSSALEAVIRVVFENDVPACGAEVRPLVGFQEQFVAVDQHGRQSARLLTGADGRVVVRGIPGWGPTAVAELVGQTGRVDSRPDVETVIRLR